MELLVFGHNGRKVLFFPTRMARFYDYENWGIIHALYDRIYGGELQLFCVDSIDCESFYNQSIQPADRIVRHQLYEQYILDEVVPFMLERNGGDSVEVAGCSMGAYHAVNIATRHPSLFKRVIAMSGRFDLTIPVLDFRNLFDDYHNADIYFHMPAQFIANIDDEVYLDALRQIEFIFAIGETDPFVCNNHHMSQLLWYKDIPNQLYIWTGYAHRPRYWKQMVQLYL